MLQLVLVGLFEDTVVYARSKSKRSGGFGGGINEAVLGVLSRRAGSDVGDGVCPSFHIDHDSSRVARASEPPLINLSWAPNHGAVEPCTLVLPERLSVLYVDAFMVTRLGLRHR
jgi:hypothetical protein